MRIDHVLNDEHSSLGKLIQRARVLDDMNVYLQKLLPENIAKECRIANYEAGLLVITASSAAFLTQLRYRQSELIETLRQDPAWCGLRNLKLKVACPLDVKV